MLLLFRGLSAEDVPEYEAELEKVCQNIARVQPADVQHWSSIRFGMEMALADLQNGGLENLFSFRFHGRKKIYRD